MMGADDASSTSLPPWPSASGGVLPEIAEIAGLPPRRTAAFTFDVGKYCPPLDPACIAARAIFSRIVNIPAHGNMAAVADEELSRMLNRLHVDAKRSDGVVR